ncbi:MAG TPA: twin-arginine translocase subunit TatC [Ktedonobacteraceae bacterium]|jgi:sec-independent protein translocase protein TatC|nr:twin-arginine translocase subunit TatC [Ktedonobacteraceae bacterium]
MATGNIGQRDSMVDDDYMLDEDEVDESQMTLIEHLEELRWRIFKSLIGIVIGAIVAFIFREQIMHFLTLPLPKEADVLGHGNKLVVQGVAEGFTVFLKLSVAVGFLIALPLILYQAWAFISPGLYSHEKKTALPFVFIGIFLFLAGISLGYIVLQYPVQWLINFAATDFTELVTADSYFTFVAFFLLAFGIVFEIPLVLTFLAQLGIITSQTLKKKRAVAHVSMWIAATFLTPGADPYSPVILGAAMSCLYELTILFIRFTKH